MINAYRHFSYLSIHIQLSVAYIASNLQLNKVTTLQLNKINMSAAQATPVVTGTIPGHVIPTIAGDVIDTNVVRVSRWFITGFAGN